MKLVLMVMLLLLSCAGMADEVYDRFLDLKRAGIEEWNGFYHSLSNNMSGKDGVWRENGSGRIFIDVDRDTAVTNLECFVELVNASANLVKTNLVSVSRRSCDGGTCRYRYRKNGSLTMIEIEGVGAGDFDVYQTDSNGDLEYYLVATNFIGVQGVRKYKDGRTIEIGPVPDFSIFKERGN